jgi:hypothetical protein
MNMKPISIRAKGDDWRKMEEIRKRLQDINKRSYNSDVIRQALTFTVNNWFPKSE